MRVIRVKPAVADRRGTITDVLDGIPVECVTLVTSNKGAVRGNHYHKKTTQYTYVPPRERHAFIALESSLLIACAHGPRAGRSYESDTYRLAAPLTAPSR
jgi:hypothetical protein